MKISFKRDTCYPKTGVTMFLIFILLVANFMIITDHQQQLIYEPSTEHLLSICGAIAELNYGQPRYMCPKKIYKEIEREKAMLGHTYNRINDAMWKATLLTNVNSKGRITSGGAAGPGYADYAYLAFVLFGLSIASLVWLYFFIMCISVVVFWLTFSRSPIGSLGLAVFLLSHYMIVKSLPHISGQLGSVLNYRFLPVLIILPVIHILMVSLLRKRLAGRTLISILIQSVIILFILWMRGSVIWAVVLLACVVVTKIFLNGWKLRFPLQKVPQEGSAEISGTMRKMQLWPMVLFLSMFLLLIVGKPFILEEQRKESSSVDNHPIWHSIYVGLALQPDIRKSYGTAIYDDKFYGTNRGEKVHSIVCSDKYMQGNPIKVAVKTWLCADAHRGAFEIIYACRHPIEYTPNDQDSFNASFKWLYDRGYSEYELFNFKPEEDVDYKASFGWFNQSPDMNGKRPFRIVEDFNWSRFDLILKDVIKDVVWTHPYQVAQNIFIDKPVRYIFALFKYLSYISFPIWFLLMVFFHFFMMEIEQFRFEIFQVIKLLALVFAFSLIPIFSVYPTDYIISETVLIIMMVTLITVTMLIVPKIRNIVLWRKNEKKPLAKTILERKYMIDT